MNNGQAAFPEHHSVGGKAAVSGNGYFQGAFIGLEATLKSAAAPFPTASCSSGHQVSAAEDFVFTQYYPVLRGGKGTGEAATRGHNSTLTP